MTRAVTSPPGAARRILALALLVAAAALPPGPARALCATASTGAKCLKVEPARAPARATEPYSAKWLSIEPAPPPVMPGDILPKKYLMLMNSEYYGLPPAGDGWVYFRVERDVYRVDFDTREVLEQVTHQTNRAFP